MTDEPELDSDADGTARPRAPASPDVRQAIDGLQGKDYTRLMACAKFFCRTRLRGGMVEPGDLLGEAVTRTLTGIRTWNRQDCPSIVDHLIGVMRSVSSHLVEQWVSRRHDPLPVEEVDQPSVDARARDAASEELEELLSLFEGDEEAQDVLDLRGQGYSASEIRAKLGMDERRYDTMATRIRRRLAGHLKGDK